MLLDQEDPNRVSRIMLYYEYLNRFRVRRIEAVTQRARRLEGLAQEAAEEKSRLSMLARKQDETRTGLRAAQQERSGLLSALERTITNQEASIAGLRSAAQEMRRLLEDLERRARELPEADVSQLPLTQLRGRLRWPLRDARLLSRFGSPRGDGTQRWDGVVLQATEGAEVRAIYYGQVAFADWLRGFGLLLIIEHDDGYMSLYGHNQTLLKEPGEWVEAGETVALSGSSGGRVSPGLYFAIRHRGRPLNPEQWCRRRVSQRGGWPLFAAANRERSGTYPIESSEAASAPAVTCVAATPSTLQ
jgi:septal ring factor EnvC (AmiA/AmiB activator)